MKIGILTFHNALNYGAVLQAFGLQQVLKKQGADVQIINYLNPEVERWSSNWTLKYNSFIKIIYRLVFLYAPLMKLKRDFRRFLCTNLNVTKQQYSKDDLPQNFDLVFIGSDQIWNPVLTTNMDPVFWGRGFAGRVVTYAASSGTINKFTPNHLVQIKQYLPNLDAISVRESRLQTFLLEQFNCKSEVVLDPTLLAGRDYFESICAPRQCIEKYVFAYSVENKPHFISIAKQVAKMYNARLIILGQKKRFQRPKGYSIISPSIEEFLSFIKYAECVVCLSFHGTAFSLLFEKDFYTLEGGNTDRVKEVLIPLGIQERIIGAEIKILPQKPIDYYLIRQRLAKMREKSMRFVKKQIEMTKLH